MLDNAVLIEERIDHLRLRNLSEQTIRVNRDGLRRLARQLDPVTLAAADHEHLTCWATQLLRLEPRSRYAELSRVHCFYAWAFNKGYVPDIPTRRIPRPKVPRSVPRPITEDRLKEALHGAPTDIRAFLMLAAFAGLRCCEIAGLTRDRLLLDDTPVIIVNGKGSKERVIPLHPAVVSALRLHGLPPRGFLFERRDGQRGAPTASGISQLCNRWLHGQGIPDTMHSLRHRAITQLYQASLDIRAAQEFAGHSSPQTTAGYAALSGERLKAAVMGIPALHPLTVISG